MLARTIREATRRFGRTGCSAPFPVSSYRSRCSDPGGRAGAAGCTAETEPKQDPEPVVSPDVPDSADRSDVEAPRGHDRSTENRRSVRVFAVPTGDEPRGSFAGDSHTSPWLPFIDRSAGTVPTRDDERGAPPEAEESGSGAPAAVRRPSDEAEGRDGSRGPSRIGTNRPSASPVSRRTTSTRA